MNSAQLPIAVFDSGLGGLTVLKALYQNYPNENYIYLGDTARLPYGAKSPASIKKYLKQNLHFLLQHQVKAIVIACNSASSVFAKEDSPLPAFDVIQPGAKKALEVSLHKKIGVIGTRSTIGGQAYLKALKKLDEQVDVHQQACPLLVPLVEEGWGSDPLTNLVIYRYLQPLIQAGIDTLILGCTHYPILKTAIQKVVGLDIHLVDSADAIASLVGESFTHQNIKKNQIQQTGQLKIMTTDVTDGFQQLARRIMTPYNIHDIIQVDL